MTDDAQRATAPSTEELRTLILGEARRALPPGCTAIRAEPRSSSPFLAKPHNGFLPPGRSWWDLSFDGYGAALEEHRTDVGIIVDEKADASGAHTEIAELRVISQQHRRRDEAVAAGLGETPSTREKLLAGDHLLIDRSAARALVAIHGRETVRVVRRHLARTVEELTTHPAIRSDFVSHLELHGVVAVFSFLLEPLRTGRGYGNAFGTDRLPVVFGNELILGHRIPTALETALVGRPLRDLIAGTPFDDGIVTDVQGSTTTFGDFTMHSTIARFETDLAPMWKTLSDA